MGDKSYVNLASKKVVEGEGCIELKGGRGNASEFVYTNLKHSPGTMSVLYKLS